MRLKEFIWMLSEWKHSRFLIIDKEDPECTTVYRKYQGGNKHTNERFNDGNTVLFILEKDNSNAIAIATYVIKALDMLGLVPAKTELVCFITKEEYYKYYVELPVLYGITETNVAKDMIVEYNSILLKHKQSSYTDFIIGTSLFWNEKVKMPPSVEIVFRNYLREQSAKTAKRIFSYLNNMLTDPDYSTSMNDNSFSNFSKAMKMLSFSYIEIPFETIAFKGYLELKCLPPENFKDDLADCITEFGQIMGDLLDIWFYYLDESVITFNFAFEDIETKTTEIWNIADIIGIKKAVEAYVAGVPIQDLIA